LTPLWHHRERNTV